jgi:hypothetical protein
MKGPSLSAPLVRYEFVLARRSFADAFANWRDRLLLALVAAFALLWLRDAAGRAPPGLPPQASMLALLAGPAAYGWTKAVLRRLAWFRETSVLAPQALVRGALLPYLAWAQLPLLALLSAAVLALSAWTGKPMRSATVALLSYGAGLALAAATGVGGQAIPMARPEGRERFSHAARRAPAFRTLLARQIFGAERPVQAAAFLVASSTLATLAGCWLAAAQPLTARFAAGLVPSVLLLAATARNAPEIAGLLAFAGYPARSIVFSVCALPAANLAGVSIALLLVRPEGWTGMVAALLVLHLLAALIATARAWLSPGRAARSVDLQVQLEMLALLFLASLFAPLAPMAAAWRLWLLRHHYSRFLWIQT